MPRNSLSGAGKFTAFAPNEEPNQAGQAGRQACTFVGHHMGYCTFEVPQTVGCPRCETAKQVWPVIGVNAVRNHRRAGFSTAAARLVTLVAMLNLALIITCAQKRLVQPGRICIAGAV